MTDIVKVFSIATNNYHEFEESFCKSFENNFLPSYKKEFIIFTDNLDLDIYKKIKNITPIYMEHRPWPYITLSRYQKITENFDIINERDLCIFADIDLEVANKIENIECKKYFGVNHPGNYNTNLNMCLERNFSSEAYVDIESLPKTYKYIQGCFWGGIGSYFKEMVLKLQSSVKKDLDNNIVARWHDESHLNKFCIENIKDFNILDSSYAYPEKWNLPFLEKNIIHKDKSLEQFPRFEGI
jgi:hypothetical protein